MEIEYNSLLKLSAVSVIELIKNKEFSCVEYSELCIDRIKKHDDKISAFECFNSEMLLEKANFIDDLLKNNVSIDPIDGIIPTKLYGLPVGIKDVFNTEDMPTCMGSPIWDGFTPGNDARVVTRIKRAGGIMAGKTVTAEFAVHEPGKTRNPKNINYSPGTSSSGSAAAVAAHMIPFAIGTQTAGSTIRPASYCGVYGFKPSFGLIPRTGILKTLDTLDHVTLFARFAEDIEILFNIARVDGPNYPIIEKKLNKDLNNRQKKWRVAFIKTHTWNYAEAYVKKALTEYIEKLKKNPNFEVFHLDLPELFTESHSIHATLYDKALSYYFKDEFRSNPEKVSKIMTDLILRGQEITVDEYRKCLKKQVMVRDALSSFFKENKLDGIITHSTAGIAPLFEDTANEKPDPCLMWTLCGVPSINIPAFKTEENMPFGFQLISERYRDYTLLKITKELCKKTK